MGNGSGKVFPTIEGININKYKVWEYLCAYDRNPDLVSRLRYLAIGLGLFEAWGSTSDLFAAFHFTRHRRIYFVVYFFNALLIALGCFLIYESWFWEGPKGQTWRVAYVSIGLLVGFFSLVLWSRLRTIRKNFIHTMRVLTTSQYIVRLQDASFEDDLIFKELEREILEGAFHKYSIERNVGEVISKVNTRDVESAPNLKVDNSMGDNEVTVFLMDEGVNMGAIGGIENNQLQTDAFSQPTVGVDQQPNNKILLGHELNSSLPELSVTCQEREFHLALLEISRQKNQFNDLPMYKVINFFYIMCCPALQDKVPQMDKEDFISFLKMAFLGAPKIQNLRFKHYKNKKKYIRGIFYQFLVKSQTDAYEGVLHVRDRYAALIYEHFEGFSEKNVLDNFSKDESIWLTNIRDNNQHRIPMIQELPK